MSSNRLYQVCSTDSVHIFYPDIYAVEAAKQMVVEVQCAVGCMELT